MKDSAEIAVIGAICLALAALAILAIGSARAHSSPRRAEPEGMGQASAKLRRSTDGYLWWCPACDEMHPLPDGWTFDGNLDRPTFMPSFRHSGAKRVIVDGKWTGEWERDEAGNPKPWVCHYVVTAGIIAYCGDSTHAMASQSVTMPDLPPEHQDA